MVSLLSTTVSIASFFNLAYATSMRKKDAHKLIPFESFVELHGRTYLEGSAEHQERKALYEQRKSEAETHNSDPARLWTAGVNKLWDWTESELQTLRGWDGSSRPAGGGAGAVRKHAAFLQQEGELPKEKIWSDLAMSHRIKNQGDCGSCWAIASASVLEGHYEIYKGTPRTFSAQQIVACTPNPRHCGGDGGCQGATAELAMDWVLKHGCPEDSDSSSGTCGSGSPTLAMAQVLADDWSAAPAALNSLGMTGWETLPKKCV
jgi:cathepsin L